MLKNHWTLNFLAARLRVLNFERRNPGTPWLTAQAIGMLEQLLRKSDRLVEFGSGRSTLWFASRCEHVVSIEHDERWYAKVKPDLAQKSNVDYRLASATGDAGADPPYLHVFDELADDSVDVVVNDGKLRHLVGERSLAKLRSGGLIVFDNAERYLPNPFRIPESRGLVPVESKWEAFEASTRDWRRIWTSNGVHATLLMFKP